MSDDKKTKTAPVKKDGNSIKKPTNIDDHVMIPHEDDSDSKNEELKKFKSDYAAIKKSMDLGIDQKLKDSIMADFFSKNKKFVFTTIGLNPRGEFPVLKTMDGMSAFLDIALALTNKKQE